MTFSNPEAFWLIPIGFLLAWFLPQLGLKRPLRIAVLLLLMLAWSNPHLERFQPGVDLWVLLDQSDSVQEFSTTSFRETERLLKEGRGPHDRLFFVEMAEEVMVRDPAAPELLPGSTNATRLSHALQVTLSQRESNRATRVLYIGDGFSTEPLDQVSDRLIAENIPLDLRTTTPDLTRDVRLEEIVAPSRVRPGEPFLIDAWISGPRGSSVEVSFRRGGEEIDRQQIQLRADRERVRWASEIRTSGAVNYTVQIASEGDPLPGNNQQQAWVEASGGNRVLLLTAYDDDPLVGILGRDGLEVQKVTDTRRLTVGALSGVGAVWIHNVHASRIPREFQEGLEFFVNEQGGGVVMVGGRSSFGAGGYHESPLDPLLPVTMELKEEDRKVSIALAIVMDRSGSMGAGVGPGQTKMDLANAGAARAIELLGQQDSVAVFAVDTEPHTIVPLSRAGDQREKLIRLVRRIQSGGGGIYVFNGLEAAWEQLKNAPQTQRHVILFADAADAEQPEGVGELIKEMGEGMTTVSVIALGDPSDPDAPFLEQISVDGQGRLFFNSDPSTLPSVFAQETVSVSRSAFLEEPTPTESTAGWREIAPAAPQWPEIIDGYNLNYLREEATESLRSGDEYAAPLIAHWERGLGRAVALAMPVGGPNSETMRGWDEVGDTLRTLNRWVLRKESPPGIHVSTKRIGDTLRVTLQANREWQDRFATEAPELVTTQIEQQDPILRPWRRISPGLLQTDIPLKASARLRGSVRVGDQVLPFGPVNGQPGSEWIFDQERLAELKALSLASNGRNLTSLSEAWIRPPQEANVGTRLWWLWACLAAFIFEAYWSRIGGQRIGFEKQRHSRTKSKPEKPQEKQAVRKEPDTEPKRRSAFQRAKR